MPVLYSLYCRGSGRGCFIYGPEGVILAAVVAVAALVLATRRLESFELTDTD